MIELSGKSVCKGIAIGRIKLYSKAENDISRKEIDNSESEISRYESAKVKAIDELQSLYEKAVEEVGEDNAEIFRVHMMMLEDESYNDSVHNIISEQRTNAEYAVGTTSDIFFEMFSSMDDEYFKARSADIKDISGRVIRVLNRSEAMFSIGEDPVILMAEDLTPSETVQMDRSKLLSFVTRLGSGNSHTAILARTMSIPALTGVDVSDEYNGQMAIVDGNEGKLYLDPSEDILNKYFALKRAEDEKKTLLLELKGKENVTKSGKKIELFSNIGNLEDLDLVIQNDADGIGLFRSEFLYLEKDVFPTEEEQFNVYRKVIETMDGKKVVIRTFDIGTDKQVDYFDLDKEDNPAMGYRAIRICLSRPEIFRTQLRALYRASAFGSLAIMYPMIISVDEVIKIKEISKSVREELIAEGIKIGNVEEGIMIETPAAAIMSDELAKHVDFFSIGTNDLTQFTLAIDRQNSKLDSFCDIHHPALLRLIKMVADNGHKEGIWTGICGELAADTSLTEEFIRMGIDELSIEPGSVLNVRSVIRDIE